jgi:hypothetical protein
MTIIKSGDLVRFLDEVGEGRVVRIISNEMAEIETTDGWILPAYIRKLVVIPESISLPVEPASKIRNGEIVPKTADKELPVNLVKRSNGSKSPAGKIPPKEVDLHINILLDKVIGLSNTEILTIQLDVFRKELNQSIRNNEREIIFIHGIGNGTLKHELRRVASQEFGWCSQEDASFKEYGFGATRIRIPQNKPF